MFGFVKNTKKALKRIKEYSKEKSNNIGFTEEDEVFERIGSCDVIQSGKLVQPTTDQGYYARQLDLKGEDLVGFFTGDYEEWTPILMRDEYLPSEGQLCVAEFKFPKGTPYIKGKRPVTLADSDDFVEEIFIVTDEPIKPHDVKILSDSEVGEFEMEVENILNAEDKWYEDDDEYDFDDW
jgi:hypothetical protein